MTLTDNEALLVDVIRELREAVHDVYSEAEYVHPDVAAYVDSAIAYCDRVLAQFGVSNEKQR